MTLLIGSQENLRTKIMKIPKFIITYMQQMFLSNGTKEPNDLTLASVGHLVIMKGLVVTCNVNKPSCIRFHTETPPGSAAAAPALVILNKVYISVSELDPLRRNKHRRCKQPDKLQSILPF